MGAEQSNTSIVFEDEHVLKLYRRLEAGINPELELLRFLTEHGFERIPRLEGWAVYVGTPMDATLAILQEFVTGDVTVHKGVDYLFLRKVLVRRDLGNFR